jgi:hypothetical protein
MMLSLAFIRILLHVSAPIVSHHQAYIKNAGTQLLNRKLYQYGSILFLCHICTYID